MVELAEVSHGLLGGAFRSEGEVNAVPRVVDYCIPNRLRLDHRQEIGVEDLVIGRIKRAVGMPQLWEHAIVSSHGYK